RDGRRHGMLPRQRQDPLFPCGSGAGQSPPFPRYCPVKTTDLAPFLEARLARRVRVRLDDSLEALPHDVSERLRVARAQALLRARRPGSKAGTRRAAREDGAPSWPWRLASALPAVLLLVGLWGIGEWVDWEQI